MPNPNRIIFRMGKRVYLRPVLREDLPRLTVWINDPQVTKNLFAFHPYTPEDEEAWVRKISENHGKSEVLAIVLEDSDEAIGVIEIRAIDQRNSHAEMGFSIGNKAYWNQGYGTEALMLILEYAFNTLNLRKVHSTVNEANPRSRRCLEKCGYREEGRMKEHFYSQGRFLDVFQMAVFKADFLKIWGEYREKNGMSSV
jgi:RimJ/RimL family protein N-acetyltransferase